MIFSNLIYGLLSLQIFSIFYFPLVAKGTISFPLTLFSGFIFGIIIAVALFAFSLSSIIKLNESISIISIFILNAFLLKWNIFFNLIPFAALYLYLLDTFKNRHLLNKKIATFTFPVVLLGFIPLKLKGTFEKPLENLINAALYSTPSTKIANNNSSGTFAISTSGNLNIALNTGKELYTHIPAFKMILINLAIIIVLVILIMFLVKSYKTEKNKALFAKEAVTAISIFAFLIAITGFIFFKVVRPLMSELIKEIQSRYSNLPANKQPPKAIPINKIFNRTLTNNPGLASHINNTLSLLGTFTVIVVIILGIYFIYVLYNTFFKEKYPNEMFEEKKIREYKNKIRKKGIEASLEEITNPSDYIKFLYFSLLYLLSKKKLNINKYETPDEFLARVEKVFNTQIKEFEIVTTAFDKVKYSKENISEEEFKRVRSVAPVLIELFSRKGQGPITVP